VALWKRPGPGREFGGDGQEGRSGAGDWAAAPPSLSCQKPCDVRAMGT
jgi:hypothetical protein